MVEMFNFSTVEKNKLSKFKLKKPFIKDKIIETEGSI